MRRVVVGMLLAAALAAVGGEAALRLARFGPRAEALGPYVPAAPWERLRSLDGRGAPRPLPHGRARFAVAPGHPPIDYRLDALGLRVDGPAAKAPGGRACRVLAVGDAYTFGYGLAARDAYPAALARRLRRGGPAVVWNAGFPNADVEATAARLRALVPVLRPDVVVVTFSWWNVPLDDVQPPRPARLSRTWIVANVDEKLSALGTRIGLVHEGFRRVRHALTPAVFPPSGLAREVGPRLATPASLGARWDRTARALADVAAAVSAAGAWGLVVATPLDLEVDARRNVLYRTERLPYPSHGFVDADYAAPTAMPAALAGATAGADLPLLDLAPIFRRRAERRPFLDGDYHLSAAGARLVARAVARWIVARDACAPAPGLAVEARTRPPTRTSTAAFDPPPSTSSPTRSDP
jgi:lysophospholipase L1-like esterase